MEIHQILAPLVLGISNGCLYAIVASGMALVFGVMRVINVAQGEFLMLGAYLSFYLYRGLGLHPLLTLAIVVPVMFGIGALIEFYIIDRIAGNEQAGILLTFGLSTFLSSLAIVAFTANFVSIVYLGRSVRILGVPVAQNAIVVLVGSGLTAVCLFAFLKFTLWGKAVRATAQNAALAMARGINVKQVRALCFGIGAALASVGGVLVLISYAVHPLVGFEFLLKMFVVVILGGLGNMMGAFVAGLVMGVAESFALLYLPAGTAQALAFFLVPVILLVRPTGLFSAEE